MAHVGPIDHAVIAVRDLDRAHDTYTRLGFTLTPRGTHSLGSQNHCIMFGADYLELLAFPKVHAAFRDYAAFLEHGEGVAALAFSTPDANAARTELRAVGIETGEPLDFSRPVRVADGERDAVFRIVQLPAGQTPGCRSFLCQHYTREVVWRAQWQQHALGVTGLAAVGIVVDDPVRDVRAYASLLGRVPRAIDEGWLVDTGRAPIALATRGRLGRRLTGAALPARPRPLVAALFFHVADRAHAAAGLDARGFAPVMLIDGSVAVDAPRAHGVTLVFG